MQDELFVSDGQVPCNIASAAPPTATETLTILSDWLSSPPIRWIASRYAPKLNTPACLIEMLLLIEDKRFPFHLGIDPIAICRATIFNLRGRALQGASTIAQQLYSVRDKETRVGLKRRTFRRKIRQSLRALNTAMTRSKGHVLEEYIENVYWGGTIFGIDAAARKYFGTQRSYLSPAQSFFLAERIAMPNRCSLQRIKNLLQRPGIQSAFRRYQIRLEDVVNIYADVFGRGGGLWQLLEK